jgi:hypothetical protein
MQTIAGGEALGVAGNVILASYEDDPMSDRHALADNHRQKLRGVGATVGASVANTAKLPGGRMAQLLPNYSDGRSEKRRKGTGTR